MVYVNARRNENNTFSFKEFLFINSTKNHIANSGNSIWYGSVSENPPTVLDKRVGLTAINKAQIKPAKFPFNLYPMKNAGIMANPIKMIGTKNVVANSDWL